MNYIDVAEAPITIDGMEEPVIIDYFSTINQGRFDQTAILFTIDGKLHAPFEQPIEGREAISSYLVKEAKGMKLLPKQGKFESKENDVERIHITGKVKTTLFSVNVAWYFNLNQARQITSARIKLLASPQELLGLKQIRN